MSVIWYVLILINWGSNLKMEPGLMIEIGILIFGIVLLILGKISLNKFEKNRINKGNNSGVFLQRNTLLLCCGFIFVLVSLLSLFLKS